MNDNHNNKCIHFQYKYLWPFESNHYANVALSGNEFDTAGLGPSLSLSFFFF